MFYMEIKLDEQKIISDGQYTVAELHERLRHTLAATDIEQREPNIYYGKGDKDDFSRFGGAILMLKKQRWFLPYVEKWLWYTETGIEDVAAHYRNRTV